VRVKMWLKFLDQSDGSLSAAVSVHIHKAISADRGRGGPKKKKGRKNSVSMAAYYQPSKSRRREGLMTSHYNITKVLLFSDRATMLPTLGTELQCLYSRSTYVIYNTGVAFTRIVLEVMTTMSMRKCISCWLPYNLALTGPFVDLFLTEIAQSP
jgi:hypothetical protein